MDVPTQILFSYVAGLVVCGTAATIFELSSNRQLSFAPPFFSRDHHLQFLLAVLISGPFMLLNDALSARRMGNIARTGLICAFATASIWVWALGQVAVKIADRVVLHTG